MPIIEKILNEAAILSESRKLEWKPIRPGNHERNPQGFLKAVGINSVQDGRGMIRLFNYLKSADGGFLSTIIDELDFRQKSGTTGMILIEFTNEFMQTRINELNTREEKISHVMGSIINALKQRRWLNQDFEIEAVALDVDRFRIYKKGDNDANK